MMMVYPPCLSASLPSQHNYPLILHSLLQKITHDLRDTLQPIYQTLLQRLLKLLTRTISPNSLTSLLATFSAVFKYLLIASFSPESITLTWEEISTVLPRCIPDIQTAFAEVWGSVLRRLKAHARDATVTLMLNDLEQLEDMVAWCFVSGCKVRVAEPLANFTDNLVVSLANFAHRDDILDPTPSSVSSLMRRPPQDTTPFQACADCSASPCEECRSVCCRRRPFDQRTCNQSGSRRSFPGSYSWSLGYYLLCPTRISRLRWVTLSPRGCNLTAHHRTPAGKAPFAGPRTSDLYH